MGQNNLQTTYQRGLFAEALCRAALRLKFYRVLASRYRSPHGEIDIIASRGRVVALVEVKARPSLRDGMEAISPHQRARLERAASDFLARHPRFQAHDIRFDVMVVAPNRWPVHIPDAWRPM
jgi:putative endonuclease